ncbi:MAG: hypothetical protein OEV28_14300 [Nitrospirota bacterium]|nr:hypothetical protein [Nitrospirota bacterium]
MKYIVKDTHIQHGTTEKDIKLYGPGDEIELTEEQAGKLGVSVVPKGIFKK